MRRSVIIALAVLALGLPGAASAQVVPHLGEVDVASGTDTVHAQATSPSTAWHSLRWAGDGRALSAVRTSHGRPVAVSTDGAVVLPLRGFDQAELAPGSDRVALLRIRRSGLTLSLRGLGATPTGTRRRHLTDDESNGRTAMRWSPDGRRLAVGWQTGAGGWRLVVLEVPSLRIVRAVRGPGELDLSPGAWAPDCRRLVYAFDHQRGLPPEFDSELRILDVGSARTRQLARPHRWLGVAAWAPAGERIAMSYDFTSLGTVNAAGGATTTQALPDQRELHALAWSPDGTSLALAYSRDLVEDSIQLGVLDVATGSLRPLHMLGPGEANELAWSPDGTRIAYGVRTG
jgi:dipeptidyl aminopeptidase/acylaminoacyl peptidase